MKKIISLILLVTMSLNIGIYAADDIVVSAPMTVTRTFVDSSNPITLSTTNLANNRVTVRYTIQPNPILESELAIEYPDREVVLVIDNSGSMAWGVGGRYSSGPSRMSIAIDAAERFVNNLAKTPNIKVSVVAYAYRGDILKKDGKELFQLSDEDEYDDLIELINGIRANGGTNIGDGIRRGRDVLNNGVTADKFMVVLSDGEPTYYSMESGSSTYSFNYLLSDGYASSVSGNSTNRSLEYAKRMARNFDYLVQSSKSYYVAFSSLEASNKLTAIANTINAYHNLAEGAAEIDEVYSDIAEDIVADIRVKDLVFSEYLPNGLSYHSSTRPMAQIGNKLTTKIDDVPYSLNEAGTHYVAEAITFDITYNVTQGGNHVFDQSILTYTDINSDEVTLDYETLNLSAVRTPVNGVTVSRIPGTNSNQLNWDVYPGAVGYKVYKDVNGTAVLVDNVVTTNSEKIVDIMEEDVSTTTYYVEAILQGDKSQKGSGAGDTRPQIMNIAVQRTNEKFQISWDEIPGANYYDIMPIFNGTNQSNNRISTFDVVNGRVFYTYDLDPAIVYDEDDYISFGISGLKDNGTVINPNTSSSFLLEQLVETTIDATDLSSFYYANEKTLNIEYKTVDTFPLGVNIYNPLLVFELNLPTEVTDTPLEYTYSTVDAFDDNVPMNISTLRASGGSIKVFIELNDSIGNKITILESGKTINLEIDFAVAYGSVNGVLRSEIYEKLKPIVPGMNVFEIDQNIEALLAAKYSSPNTMLEVKSYILYNNTLKTVTGISNRDLIMGVSVGYIQLQNKPKISTEF